MTDDVLRDDAAALRATVDEVISLFGGVPNVLRDAARDTDPVNSGTDTVWAYQVAVPANDAAIEIVHGPVTQRLVAQGWQSGARDTDATAAVHFHRAGFDVGVMVGRSAGADVVAGGSTPVRATAI